MDVISVVIPIYQLFDFRLSNFEFVLKHLSELECDIVVYEQQSEFTKTDLESRFRVTHIVDNIESANVIHKSKLINRAATCMKSKYIWMVDADFFTNYKRVLEYVNKNDYDLIRPFSSVLFLNEYESGQLISADGVSLNGDYSANDQTGKFSFIVKRELFTSAGGMNEEFVGWGFQDLDFVENRLPPDVSLGIVEQNGYHLYHDRPSQKYADTNYKLYSNTRKLNKSTIQHDSLIEYGGRNFA